MTDYRFGVIGMGYFGAAIARILSGRGAEVIAMDSDSDRIESIKDDVAYAVALDATDKKALESQGIADLDAVVVAIGENFEGLLLCTFNLQEIGVKRIIARASQPSQAEILKKMGVNEILQPELEVGRSIAESLLNPSVLMCLNLPDDYEIVEVKTPRLVANRSLADIGLRNKYKLNLVTILRESVELKKGVPNKEKHILGVPTSDTLLESSDTIVLFGETRNIERFIKINT